MLRLKQGALLTVFDTQGQGFEATLVSPSAGNKKGEQAQAQIRIDQAYAVTSESNCHITLIQCLCKSDKMDWIIQKTTELGINEIVPVNSDYSDIKIPTAKLEKRRQHWQGIATHASEQSKRHRIPFIHPISSHPTPLLEAIARQSHDLIIALEPKATMLLSEMASKSAPSDHPSLAINPSITLIIGPEGGFSQQELDSLQQHHVKQCSLGPRVLRAETAAIIATGLIQSIAGDL